MSTAARQLVRSLLNAVEARDIEAVISHFSVDGSWQNVPHPAAVGHDAIRELLGGILSISSQVKWDVVTEAYTPTRAWLERVDRFWLEGQEHAVRCNGVLEIDVDANLITELRDYVDLGEWRARLAAAGLLT